MSESGEDRGELRARSPPGSRPRTAVRPLDSSLDALAVDKIAVDHRCLTKERNQIIAQRRIPCPSDPTTQPSQLLSPPLLRPSCIWQTFRVVRPEHAELHLWMQIHRPRLSVHHPRDVLKAHAQPGLRSGDPCLHKRQGSKDDKRPERAAHAANPSAPRKASEAQN